MNGEEWGEEKGRVPICVCVCVCACVCMCVCAANLGSGEPASPEGSEISR